MINKILEFLTFGKFYIGQQRDILIFDAKASNFLSEYFDNNKFSFFYSRKEKFEIYVFFLTLFKNGTNNFGKNYFNNYLKVYQPKYIFSMWVLNDYLFFVKDIFPSIKIIIVQGNRLDIDLVKKIYTYPKNSFDLYFTFRERDKKILKRKFNENSIIPIGSIKNNHFFENKDKLKKKLIFFSGYKLGRFSHDEKIILKSLDKYCGMNNLKFDIQIRYKHVPNKYLKTLKIIQIENNDKILIRNDYGSSYTNSNNYNVLVLNNSTLTDEFISNYKRVVNLSSHEDFDDKEYAELNCGKRRYINFDNPMFKEMLPKNFSWTSNLNEKNIFKILDNVIECDERKWREHVDQYRNRFLFDQDNKIFMDKLKEIGIKSKLIK